MIGVNAKYIWAHEDLWSHKYTLHFTLFSKTCLESFEIYVSFQNTKTKEKNPDSIGFSQSFGLFVKCDAQIYMSSLSPVRL